MIISLRQKKEEPGYMLINAFLMKQHYIGNDLFVLYPSSYQFHHMQWSDFITRLSCLFMLAASYMFFVSLVKGGHVP